MSSFDKQRLELVKDEVHESDLRKSHKADITELLTKAGNATNGCEDKPQAITEAIAALAVCFARDAMYRREDFRELMKAEFSTHVKECPIADEIPTMVIETMKAQATREDGSIPGQATVTAKGIKAQADPGTVKLVAIAAMVCFAISAYIVKTIMG